MSQLLFAAAQAALFKRQDAGIPEDETDPIQDIPGDDEASSPMQEEIFSSWALFILIILLMSALWSSYFLQQRRIQAVHETVLSIFYGMIVGLIIRILPGHYIQDSVTFNSSYFFNILLPPIILNSGYELHQANFFRNIGSILTFAIAGTFISALVLGSVLYVWAALGIESLKLPFVDCVAVGATLSATDPVTILSIFNAYKVDPKLYTIIFGESLLNDAISIVMFETAQKFYGHKVEFSSFFQAAGLFLMTFTISLLIGVIIGILIALILKHSHLRRHPQVETCLVLLCAYESYFFSNGCHMSGIVSLLFCGITLKHYAYYNMSRRTQIATKYIFQLLAQLSENFIFIYLGLSLFTEVELVYKPLFIIVTTIAVMVSRWCAVFPLSWLLNAIYRSRARRTPAYAGGAPVPDEIPANYQMMLFWAGLRGAVGVALAMGIVGENASTLLATVLVVVVLTVIIFGGTTAGMLEILNIKTGCVDEVDSDDEFDIEASAGPFGGRPKSGGAIGLTGMEAEADLGMGGSGAVPGERLTRTGSASSTQLYRDDVGFRSRASSGAGSPDLSDLDGSSDFSELPPMAGPSRSAADTREEPGTVRRSMSGLLSNLGTSVNLGFAPSEGSKWFHELDEQILKPVLLDNKLDGSPEGEQK